jgi:hypothetical protein
MGRRAGFRFGWQDGVAIGLCAGATWIGWHFLGPAALLFPVTLGHFFLFCNVFRFRRSYEIYWSLVFLLNVGVWLFRGHLPWLSILAIQTPVTLAFILLEIKSPRYHGVLWQRLNPSCES